MEERWDIYDKNKQLTGRTMKRNDWTLKDDEYHLTVLGVIRRSDGKFDHKESYDKGMGTRMVGSGLVVLHRQGKYLMMQFFVK